MSCYDVQRKTKILGGCSQGMNDVGSAGAAVGRLGVVGAGGLDLIDRLMHMPAQQLISLLADVDVIEQQQAAALAVANGM
jgi:hypothetical protein